MAIYSERNANTILSFATDPEAQPMFIAKVNGDPGLVGAAVGLSVGGHVTVAFDGTVTFDDAALGALSVGQQLNDSLIATVSDGLNEVDVTVNLEINGIQDTSSSNISFGGFTRAGAGGVDMGGLTITGGNGDGYFNIVGGKLVISAAGQGAVSGSHFLNMSDGSTLEITIVPNRLDVTTSDELITACQAAEAINPGIDFDIVVRDGSVLGAPGVSFTVTQVVMSGEIHDANRGVANSAYDPDHVATMSGGSITVRSETPLGARVSGEMRFFGCDNIRISGLIFDNAASDSQPETFVYSDATNFFGPSSSMYQLIVSEDNWVPTPTRGRIIVEQNLFTSPDGKAPGRWARTFLAREMGEVIFQDNETRKVYIGPMGKNTKRWVTNRNLASLHIDDHFRCFEHNNPDGSSVRWEAVGNVIMPPLDDVAFAGAHVDAFQYGHPNDAADTELFLHKNYVFGQIPARIWPGETIARQVQGFFGNMKDNGRAVTGEISRNFAIISAVTAVQIDNGQNVVVRHNTFIDDSLSIPQRDSSEPRILFKADAVSCVCTDNICGNIFGEPGSGVVYLNNFDQLDARALAGGFSYPSVFDGPSGGFGFTAGLGSQFTLDMSSAAAAVADADAFFAPKSGGGAEDKGHLGT